MKLSEHPPPLQGRHWDPPDGALLFWLLVIWTKASDHVISYRMVERSGIPGPKIGIWGTHLWCGIKRRKA